MTEVADEPGTRRLVIDRAKPASVASLRGGAVSVVLHVDAELAGQALAVHGLQDRVVRVELVYEEEK